VAVKKPPKLPQIYRTLWRRHRDSLERLSPGMSNVQNERKPQIFCSYNLNIKLVRFDTKELNLEPQMQTLLDLKR
jgi:curved DNA-binding protein CbpA